jgi:hypothetical protein
MLFFPLILLAVGLIFLAISKKIDADVERLDSNYTGDLLPNAEEEAMYYFEKRKKVRNSKGAKYFSYLMIFWSIVYFLLMIGSIIFEEL